MLPSASLQWYYFPTCKNFHVFHVGIFLMCTALGIHCTKSARDCIKWGPGARFSKVPRTFRAQKAISKTAPAYSVKPVFCYVVKGILFKITAKFRASRRLCFEDTKRNLSPEKFSGLSRNGSLDGLEVICVQKHLHIHLNFFYFIFSFWFFYHWTEILSLLSRVKHGRYMFTRYKGGSSLVIF